MKGSQVVAKFNNDGNGGGAVLQRRPQRQKNLPSVNNKRPQPKVKKSGGKKKNGPQNANQSIIRDKTTHNSMASSIASNPITVTMERFPMYEFCAATVSMAVQQGWQAITSDPNNIYYAMVQLGVIICEYIQSENKTSLIVPQFVADVIVRLMMQDTNHNNMLVNYKFFCDFDPTAFVVRGNLGPGNRFINFATAGNIFINLLWPEVVDPPAFNAELGANAIQSLWTFLDNLGKSKKHTRFALVDIIDVYDKTPRDGSAYAWNIASVGGNSGVSGGMSCISVNESQLLSPPMACWAPIPNSGLPSSRSASFSNISSVSPAILAVMAIQGEVPWSLRKKTGPIFQPLDFGEFLMRVTVWLQMVAQKSLDDYQNQNVPIANYTLQITSQNWAIMWRAVFCTIFGNSQQAAQFLYPYTASAPILFQPFVVGPNEGPIGFNGSGPQLPQSFYENLYALGMTNAYLKKNKSGKVKAGGRIYAPMFGTYDGLFPDLDSYKLTKDETIIPLFKPSGGGFVMVDKEVKGKVLKEKVMLDTVINIVDGSIPGNKIVQLGYGESLLYLTTIYNDYIDTYIKPFTGVVCGPSPDGGIRALKLPGAFSFSQSADSVSKEKIERLHKLLHMRKFDVTTEPYVGVIRRSVNYTSEVLSATQDLFHCWQYPNWLASSGQSPTDVENLLKLRIYGKTQVFVADDATKGTSLLILAIENATANVRARNGDDTLSDTLLKNFALMGDGSILPMAEALLTGINIVGSLLGGRNGSRNFKPLF